MFYTLNIYIFSDVLYDKYFNFSMEELQDDIYVLYYSSEYIYIYSEVLYDKYFNFSMMEELQDDIYVLYYSSEFVRVSHET